MLQRDLHEITAVSVSILQIRFLDPDARCSIPAHSSQTITSSLPGINHLPRPTGDLRKRSWTIQDMVTMGILGKRASGRLCCRTGRWSIQRRGNAEVNVLIRQDSARTSSRLPRLLFERYLSIDDRVSRQSIYYCMLDFPAEHGEHRQRLTSLAKSVSRATSWPWELT